MNKCTSHIGPLGSSLHVLRADAETIEALAGIEWNERFRRVGLDPVRELWRLSVRKDSDNYHLDFYALHPPELLGVSRTLPGHRPQDVVGAMDGVRFGRTSRERRNAVTRVLRKHGALRVREEQAAYAH